MQTYTGSLPGFVAGVEEGLNCTGERLGVGLSAADVPCTLNSSFYRARFEAMARSSQKLGINVSQVSVWGKLAVNTLAQECRSAMLTVRLTLQCWVCGGTAIRQWMRTQVCVMAPTATTATM